MTIQDYIRNISRRYSTGISREHSYRGDLQTLLESMLTGVLVTNEPARFEFGAPDYILTKKDVPVGFIEAKDIGDTDLEGVNKSGNKEQFDRYKESLDNIIFTDYLDFLLYREGELVTSIRIAEIKNGRIVAKPENFDAFESLIKSFVVHSTQPIRNAKRLAELMAGKARLLYDVLEKALSSDEKNNQNSTLKDQMYAFKEILIHDITPEGFADIYAQTIAYGLFAARLHDSSLDTFSRQEAAELIPRSNPFLRRLFGYIAGPDIDDRIKWIVDNLAHIFLATDIKKILKNYGKSTKMEDPIIHFYETFLSEYDSNLRRARGVWYTPQPVVNFIVRAVDDVLKDDFGLSQGLADTSKTTIKVDSQTADKRSSTGYKQIDKQVHKVQILDPATGTGTFLAETIKQIYSKFKGQEGLWSNYVEEHLLPRLNGFELLMASYAMAHLQLNLLLTEKGFRPNSDQRLRVYLTNSLEEYHKDTGTLFAGWLSSEANEANYIKRDTPVMCVIGNPPYSGISSNKGKWISDLLEDYKYVDGVHFKERKHWLNDDYVKFIRYGQHYIEKNGSGVLAFINPHGYLDNPTFRGMRWNLLKTYDKIYTIDLHGNALRNEVAPDGGKDENVFDIMQGVSINVFVKTGNKKAGDLGKVFHYDLYGKRNNKYNFLIENELESINFTELQPNHPNYFFVPSDNKGIESYQKNFKLTELFIEFGLPLMTGRDKFAIKNTIEEIESTLEEMKNIQVEQFREKYKLGKDTTNWNLYNVFKDAEKHKFDESLIKKVSYRTFDERFTFYTGKSSGVHSRPQNRLNQHFLEPNIGLLAPRQLAGNEFHHVFLSDNITEFCVLSNKTKEQNQLFPLYLYKTKNNQNNLIVESKRVPNFKSKTVDKIANGIGLTFINEKVEDDGTFAPIDVLDYIYAILHSRRYRKKYEEFLKIDFARVPYPKDKCVFWQLVEIGQKLRLIHLMQSEVLEEYVTRYPIGGDNIITRRLTKSSIGYEPLDDDNGRVWINDEQYFDNVPLVAWEFYIGGYQPAQKWLKDRRDRELSFDDIMHYQKIIVALVETNRLMEEIDKVEFMKVMEKGN